MTNLDGHDCCYCPARRFPSQAALTDHIERACPVYAAERAARPRDPLAVLRDALVWAADEDRLRLIPAEFHALFEPHRLQTVKSPPGFVASLVSKSGGVEVRARLTTGGRELHLQVDIPPLLSQRTRVHLPAERFALPVERAPVLVDSRAMMDRYHEARKRGLESEVAVNPTRPALLEAPRSSLVEGV